jgi:hypothetical protein
MDMPGIEDCAARASGVSSRAARAVVSFMEIEYRGEGERRTQRTPRTRRCAEGFWGERCGRSGRGEEHRGPSTAALTMKL